MKCLHLTLMAFCHILIASAVLYLNAFTAASPLLADNQHGLQKHPEQQQVKAPAASAPATVLVESLKVAAQEEKAKPAVVAVPVAAEVSGKSSPIKSSPAQQVAAEQKQAPPAPTEIAAVPAKIADQVQAKHDVIKSPVQPQEAQKQQAVLKESAVEEKKAVVVKAAEKQTAIVQQAPAIPDAAHQSTVVVITNDNNNQRPVYPNQPVYPNRPVYPERPVYPDQPVYPNNPYRPNQPYASEPAVASQLPAVQKSPENVAAVKPPVEPLPQPVALVTEQKHSIVSAKSSEPIKEEKSAVVKEPVSSAKVDRKASESVEVKSSVGQPALAADSADQKDLTVKAQQQPSSAALPPVVKGGLGPLHLLATTLCSYQPDRPVADECLNQLYARRAHLRKSLFEFMSLKFTNLEKLSSRLGYGLQVVPVKSIGDPLPPAGGVVSPSHGWPVVGKCTAHDLKLMGEAAWCEADQASPAPVAADQDAKVAAQVAPSADEQPPKISSNQHAAVSARAQRAILSQSSSLLLAPEQSSVMSKLLHVGDAKDAAAPLVESTIYNLNLTQQQLATLEAHATSTRECRRNALRYTKALFNHLAEDQRNVSDSWPQLYALIQADDCARKRMIDIVTALSGFRTDTTSIRRDNLEFAFAMDDLRTKVLDNEVNVALTFDKQFIEVEQFLQQSVRLMLSNIDPNRAKLTSMRYRSLMYGNVAGNADDQCIELHQRLLAQSYPTDCNPNQFGQLPDVLRMTASSLELWSVEKEISLHTAKGGAFDYPHTNSAGQQKVREDVNECIANLVSS